MKKIINDPANVLAESLRGFAVAHADLVRVEYEPGFHRPGRRSRPGQGRLVSGGGAGHEPLHGGYVGAGMLDAAVPGAVFTSPTPDAVLAATQAASGGAGVLHIVKNYTGDVLNFEVAAELAGAEGIEVSPVVINDDVAVEDSTYTAGRRGVGGTVPLEKITGAAAARGDDLAAVTAIAQRVIANVRSMGMALTGRAPSRIRASRSFVLADDEIEMGIGIHGEPGRERREADEARGRHRGELLGAVVEDLPFESRRPHVPVGQRHGRHAADRALPGLRHRVGVAGRAGYRGQPLAGRQLHHRLEMQGMSVTLLKLDDELTELWDAPVHTVGPAVGSCERRLRRRRGRPPRPSGRRGGRRGPARRADPAGPRDRRR